MSYTENKKTILPVVRRLEVDDNWQVEIPVDLRDKFPIAQSMWVEVYIGFSGGDEDFNGLMDSLIHDGVLICCNPA